MAAFGVMLFSAEKQPIIRFYGLSDAGQRVAALLPDWSRAPHYAFSFSALKQAADIGQAAPSLFNAGAPFSGLPQSDGFELVHNTCTSCHSLAIVMQQSASLQRWQDMLLWMREKQGMPELHPEDEAVILAYLTREFGP